MWSGAVQDPNAARKAAEEALKQSEAWDPNSAMVKATAKEYNWTPDDIKTATDLVATAMQRAALETGVRTLGQLTGPGLSVEPAGEAGQITLQNVARAQAWSPAQPWGSYAGYQGFREQYPALYARQAQYQTIPGETQYESMAPAARANWMAKNAATDEIYARYNKLIDAALRLKPWDRNAADALYKKRGDEIDAAEARWPIPEMTTTYAAVRYGMNPQEMAQSLTEQELNKWLDTKPEWSGGDYGLYEEDIYLADLKAWRESIPQTSPAYQYAQAWAATPYQGMGLPDAVDTYSRRWETPIQAASHVYDEYVQSQYVLYTQSKEGWYTDTKTGKVVIHNRDYWAKSNPIPAMSATQLIPEIRRKYRLQGWTEAQLRQALTGITFPSYNEQRAQPAGKAPQVAPLARAGTWAPPGWPGVRI
jgi:hypothetical protein